MSLLQDVKIMGYWIDEKYLLSKHMGHPEALIEIYRWEKVEIMMDHDQTKCPMLYQNNVQEFFCASSNLFKIKL